MSINCMQMLLHNFTDKQLHGLDFHFSDGAPLWFCKKNLYEFYGRAIARNSRNRQRI